MDNSTRITYAKVIEDARTLKECASVMQRVFDDFGASMNIVGAEDVYIGDASETLGQVFARLKTKFDAYTNKIIQFADTVTSAEENTARTEKELSSDAENLRVE